MKTKDIKVRLNDQVDVVSFRDGIFTVKKSYYWGVSKDGSNLADMVKKFIPEATILDYGNHYHGFVGGAKSGSPQDSYWWVKFKA
jgi:hypothetical protein